MSEGVAGSDEYVAGTDEGMLAVLARSRSPRRLRARLRWLFLGDRAEPHPAPGCTSRSRGLGRRRRVLLRRRHPVGRLQPRRAAGAAGTTDPAGREVPVGGVGRVYIAAAFCMVAKTWKTPHNESGRCPEDDDSDPGLVDDDAPPFHPARPKSSTCATTSLTWRRTDFARIHLRAADARRDCSSTCSSSGCRCSSAACSSAGGAWGVRRHGDRPRELRAGAPSRATSRQTCRPRSGSASASAAGAGRGRLAVLGVMWRPRKDDWRVGIETWQVRLRALRDGRRVVLLLVAVARRAQALDFGSELHRCTRRPWARLQPRPPRQSLAALFAAASGYVRGAIRDERKAAAGVDRPLGPYATRVRARPSWPPSSCSAGAVAAWRDLRARRARRRDGAARRTPDDAGASGRSAR